ncbi:MAG TPA: hypothetical protein VFK70_17165, partial [Vicinamibacteria bacterium]|nr:hypothetical protein [Vicinamibacteria bacterium]
MSKVFRVAALTTAVAMFSGLAPMARAEDEGLSEQKKSGKNSIELGPRPFYLVEGMDPSPLKDKLMR